MRAFLVFLLLCLGSSIAVAEDCSNLQTQTDMTICAVNEYNKADAELNANYKKIVARLKGDPDTAKLLVEAEKSLDDVS